MPTKLTRQNLAMLATVTLEIEPETSPIDHFGPDDAESQSRIRDQLERGNLWAWFDAMVTAEYDGVIGRASLGCCSYESEKAFRDDQMADLTSEALDDLWAQLEARTPAGRAKALALSARQAIVTTFRGPTNHNGSRVLARCEAKKISVPWDHALDAGANHAAAALQLMGYVFVQVPKRSK